MTRSRIRYGMVGGGPNAFIGAVHRIAARMDDRYEIVAGALSADSAKAREYALGVGIAADRAYASYQEMIAAEAARPDRMDVVIIVTPNHLHYPIAKMALEAGFHVICDKPMTSTIDDAVALADAVKASGRHFFLTHTYTGYPMVRQAREMVAAGEIGKLRRVEAEYLQDWLASPMEHTGAKGAVWRTDPAQTGKGGAIGDIGTHAFNLAAFVSGEDPTDLLADLNSFVPGRRVDDDAMIMLRYASGAKGAILASQVLTGNGNQLSLRLYGDKGGLEWWQEKPEELWFTRLGETRQLLRRNGSGARGSGLLGSRSPAAHPEGYLEAFANLYSDAADVIEGKATASLVPGVGEGLKGMQFVEACVASNEAGNRWTSIG